MIRHVGFYENPRLKFLRAILFPFLYAAPKSLSEVSTYILRCLSSLGDVLFTRKRIVRELFKIGWTSQPRIFFSEHHLSHVLAGAVTAPFNAGKVLVADSVGELASTSFWTFQGDALPKIIWAANFPRSLGLFYSTVTAFCGFKVDSGEYKLMGLAPFGSPKYLDLMKLVLPTSEKSNPATILRPNLRFFEYGYGEQMFSNAWGEYLGFTSRIPETSLTEEYCDLAKSCQAHLEDATFEVLRRVVNLTGEDNFVFSGGVAMNCVLNGKIRRKFSPKSMHIFISPSDSGSALGAAVFARWKLEGRVTKITFNDRSSGSVFLGNSYTTQHIADTLETYNISFKKLPDGQVSKVVAEAIDDGAIVGVFRGRMEFGQRSLGARSIIASAKGVDSQQRLNLKIKFRESFRPFAPVMLESFLQKYFDSEPGEYSPFMQYTYFVRSAFRLPVTSQDSFSITDAIRTPRCEYSSAVHMDFSSRVQTVQEDSFLGSVLYELELKGHHMILNTSFNRRGEPIVCTPSDAIACFIHTDMDYLLLENYFISRSDLGQLKNAQLLQRKLSHD